MNQNNAAEAAADNAMVDAEPHGVDGAAVAVPPWARSNIVTSGEEDMSTSSSSAVEEENANEDKDETASNVADNDHLYYDPQSDLLDELYVNQQLQSGRVQTPKRADSESAETGSSQPLSRSTDKSSPTTTTFSSDATLHCPCCFQIVCLDCQQHYRYKDQFRAMFVRNIVVQWNHKIVYDESVGGLVEADSSTDAPQAADAAATSSSRSDHNVVRNNSEDEVDNGAMSKAATGGDEKKDSNDSTFYYKTVCGNCGTQVAALDMSDEVYHFYGCVASAPAAPSSPSSAALSLR